MRFCRTHQVVCGLGLALLLAAASMPAAATTGAAGQRPDLEALDWAFKFASAIDGDPSDKSRAQQIVVGDYAAHDALDEAVERSDQVEGWRRGLAYADLAAKLATAGRTDEARRLLAKAESIRATAEGWGGPRIAAHIARAHATLGDLEASRARAAEVAAADPRQYEARAAATVAIGLATRGGFDEALATLEPYDGKRDVDLSIWRTNGYLALARMERLEEDQRLRALQAARESAEGIPGWKKITGLHDVAQIYHDLGRSKQAAEVLDGVEPVVLAIASDMPIKGPLLSRQAHMRAEIGNTATARRLMEQAEPLVDNVLLTEKPGVYADFGASYMAIGDVEAAQRLFGRAVTSAEGLVNARPRALAVVAICRSMAQERVALDEGLRSRLDALHDGLGTPW